MSKDTHTGKGTSAAWGIPISILLVTVVLGVLILFDAHHQVLQLLVWIDAQGFWGPLLFMLVMVLVLVFVLSLIHI